MNGKSSPVEIVEVSGKKLQKEFARFPFRLYADCPNWVPPLPGEDTSTFNPSSNGSYAFCEAQRFLAVRGGQTVGRIAAIINHKANEKFGEKTVRFGWFDLIEDQDVFDALIGAAQKWGKERGCDTIKGPLGFTDMDKEGLLVEGFDKLSPLTCIYNYPYYPAMLEKAGFSKDADWTQRTLEIKDEEIPAFKIASQIEEHYGLHMAQAKSSFELSRKYGKEMFRVYNEVFAPLYQFTPLTDKQIKEYVSTFVPILNHRFVAICLNKEDKPVGFLITVPSLSKVFRETGGKLFPFGVFKLKKALSHNDTLEALLIGILPEYQWQGASILMFKYLHENCLKFGIKHLVMNPQLENNTGAQTMLGNSFEMELYMRRRSYCKKID